MTDQPQPPSRYTRVREILDAAAGTANPNYQGRGRFWNLPLDQFREVEIYGVRMIAPADAAADQPAACGCGCGSGGAAEAQAAEPGRGARSGLVKGLRGEFPFDGTHFPRLPWGGAPVAQADIDLIAQWIDDGCPPDDAHNAQAAQARSRALGSASYPVSLRPANALRGELGAIKQRKNVEFLSEAELAALRAAIAQLKSYPDRDHRSFKHWGQVHGDMCQHGWEQFLPWHRIYLYFFEQGLQDIDPTITLPYWDWTMTRYKGGQIPAGQQSGIIPAIYRCWLTPAGKDQLAQAGVPGQYLAALPVGPAFNSGVDFFAAADKQFAGDQAWPGYRAQVSAKLGAINPLWHPNRFPGIFTHGTIAQQFHHHYPSADDIDEMLDIASFHDFGGGTQYDESFGDLDMNPHNTVHIWSGGQNPHYQSASTDPGWGPSTGDMLSNLTAAYDPIFWGHHSNVDRMWALWQERHPGLGPAEPSAALPPYAQNVGDTLNIAKLGYEYAKASYTLETDMGQPITQFRSAALGVHRAVISKHRKAELKLHQIIQPNQSMLAHIFINQPDADASTPIRDNPHYAGHLALFGHGPCIGGPGHCDPPAPRRAYDQRPHHHNTPWNARFDITKTVRRLVRAGARDLSINIVVLGADGLATTDMLRMKAVSLSFKD